MKHLVVCTDGEEVVVDDTPLGHGLYIITEDGCPRVELRGPGNRVEVLIPLSQIRRIVQHPDQDLKAVS